MVEIVFVDFAVTPAHLAEKIVLNACLGELTVSIHNVPNFSHLIIVQNQFNFTRLKRGVNLINYIHKNEPNHKKFIN